MELNTYESVAKEYDLNERTTKRFVEYMRRRWGIPEDERVKCLVGYAGEWARRFKAGIEYGASDEIGQSVLLAIDGK
jgi:hypothetical protein